MTNIQKITEKLLEPTGYFVLPEQLITTQLEIEELDSSTFVGNEFMIIPIYMGRKVPKQEGTQNE